MIYLVIFRGNPIYAFEDRHGAEEYVRQCIAKADLMNYVTGKDALTIISVMKWKFYS